MQTPHETRRQAGLIWYGVHVLALAGIVFSVLFNVWTVEALLTADGSLEWPHTLHVWVIQGTMLSVSLVGLALVIWRKRLTVWLSTKTSSEQAAVLFWVLIALQTLLGLGYMLTKDRPGFSELGYLFWVFNLDEEFNLPAYYSTLLLGLGASLAGLAAWRGWHYQVDSTGETFTWILAAVALGYMTLDELLSLHENLGLLMNEAMRVTLTQYGWGWTFVAMPFAVLTALFFWIQFRKMFWRSPNQLLLLGLAGCIYLVGAVGMENLQRFLQLHHGLPKAPSVWLLFEEMGEMLGVTLAIRVFYQQARERLPDSPQSTQNRQ